MIKKGSRSLFVVGDEKQSIYGFRGSKVELILQFHTFYPAVREIVLNQNYRSIQPILDLAEHVISHNSNHKKVGLQSNVPTNQVTVKYYIGRNERDEAEFIIKMLVELYHDTHTHTGTGQPDVPHNAPTETEFVADMPDMHSSSDGISSMFDMYLDAEDISHVQSASSLWGGSRGLGDSYNPKSWQVPIIDWSQVEGLNDVVILYRTHAQSRAIEESLLKHRVPYKLVSGTRFLDRKEVKDVLALLRFIHNGRDKMSLSRFLPLVLPGVGAKTMDKIYAFLEDPEFQLPKRYSDMVEEFLQTIAQLSTSHHSIIDFTKALLADTGYFTYLQHEYPQKEEYESRKENIAELYSLMLQYDTLAELSLHEKLQEFLTQVMLLTTLEAKSDEYDTQPKVSLMTLHQSKGLEFETVFLVGCEDGILPHQNSLLEVKDLEEEVRLAYVGVTRAKKYLFVTAADSRVQFGQVKANPFSRIFRPFLDTHVKRAH